RTTKAVTGATRAGMGCGSCKGLVEDLMAWFCGGAVEEDPSVHHYVPSIPLRKPDLVREIKERGLRSVSSVFRELAGGREDAASKPALASLLITVWKGEYEDERDARFINDRVHANIQKDGTFSVIPPMPGGATTPAELRRIAEVAERYDVPLVKVTGGQRIDLLGVKKDDLPKVWRDLGTPSGHAYGKSYRTCKSCVGTDFCRFGLGDAIGVGVELERRMEGLYTPHKVKSAVAGCPRNCSEAYVKDIGLVAVEGGWELYVGGASGGTVRKGDLLTTVNDADDAIRLALVFLQHYREEGEYLERTYGYLERVGVEAVREVVLDPVRQTQLLERYAIAKAACDPDPWRERHAPVHPNQFAALDTEAEPLTPLDEVLGAAREAVAPVAEGAR
ncbi:MAG: NAD(P)/FAD-dependent oxidoreductase, partial [Actinomycetota bacterium]|nr:NAD(P)/FAD-dependent oxidoreductase [Actinomycetota bacterium]